MSYVKWITRCRYYIILWTPRGSAYIINYNTLSFNIYSTHSIGITSTLGQTLNYVGIQVYMQYMSYELYYTEWCDDHDRGYRPSLRCNRRRRTIIIIIIIIIYTILTTSQVLCSCVVQLYELLSIRRQRIDCIWTNI